MQPPNFSQEDHRGGKYFNSCNRYDESHINSFNRTIDCGNRPCTDRLPTPFHGSKAPFGFGSWGCSASFRGGGPSCFRAPFLGRPPPPRAPPPRAPPPCAPPPFAPRGRPPYSFTPRRLQSPSPPYFGRAGYWESHGGFNSSQCYQGQMVNFNGAEGEHGASPQGGGSKIASPLAKTRDELMHQDENHTAAMEHEILAVSTSHLPGRCTESDVCRLKHTLPSPTGLYTNGNRSPAKRIKAHDSKNPAKMHVYSDLSSRRDCTSRAKSLHDNAANIQLRSRGTGEPGGKPSYSINSIAKTSVPYTQANIKELAKGPPATAKASLHDQHCDNRGENSNLESPTHSTDSQQSSANLHAACIRDTSPDSTTRPCPKLFCHESTRDSGNGSALSSLPELVYAPPGIAGEKALPGCVAVNLLRSATTNYVRTKCLGEDAHRESFHYSDGLCSETLSTSRDDLREVMVPVLSALDDQIVERTEAHIGNSCIPHQPSTDVATGSIVSPLASFVESGGSGIAAVQKWLKDTSPRTDRKDYSSDCHQKDSRRDGAFVLTKPEQENASLIPSSALQDVVHCQMPEMSTATGPILLQKRTDCSMSTASDHTGKIDSDQETASFASTEPEDEDCVIVKCENFIHRPCASQQCNDTANPKTLACKSGSVLCSTHVPRPPPLASFDISLEDVLFELDSYTTLCVLDFCEDPVAKKQVYALYLKGMRANAKAAYTKKMKMIACAAVERKRLVWKCSTGVLRNLAKLCWTFPQVGSVPRIRELYDFEKH